MTHHLADFRMHCFHTFDQSLLQARIEQERRQAWFFSEWHRHGLKYASFVNRFIKAGVPNDELRPYITAIQGSDEFRQYAMHAPRVFELRETLNQFSHNLVFTTRSHLEAQLRLMKKERDWIHAMSKITHYANEDIESEYAFDYSWPPRHLSNLACR